MYELLGSSFREFINITTGTEFEKIGFDQLLQQHVDLARAISGKLRPIEHFRKYLQYGYYPIFENERAYPQKLSETVVFL